MRTLVFSGLLLAATVGLGSVVALQQPQSAGHTHNAPAKTLPAVPPAATPTYYGEVRPILEANCAGCHTAGGIAPFSLRDAGMAQRMSRAIGAAVSSGHMPPWMPGGDTPPLQHERKLTPQQIGTLQAWANAGAPLGDAQGAAPLPKPNIPTIRKDLTVAMNRAYTPNTGMEDDYRCFLLDPQLSEDRFVTGYNVVPGRASEVHHVILYQAPAGAREAAEAKNGADGRDGWQCFGGPGVGGTRSLEGALGSWTPGSLPTVTPEGTGALVKAGSFFVMQVHYNLAAGAKADRTKVELQLAPKGAQLDPLGLLAFIAPVELPCAAGDASKACERREAFRAAVREGGQGALNLAQGLLSFCGKTAEDYATQDATRITSTCDRRLSRDASAVGAILHMHTRGVNTKLELNPGTPGARTLLDIPAWDFHWQGSYTYQTPIALRAGDTVRLTCTWDNTRAQPARYVLWGEGTDDEMCLGALAVR